jgi:hypothetical protein
VHRVTQIGVLSLAKIMGIAGLGIGLLIGVIYALFGSLLAMVGMFGGEDTAGLAGMGIVLAGMAVVGVPLVYGGLSFVSGLIYALILNVVLGWTGGLEIRIESP